MCARYFGSRCIHSSAGSLGADRSRSARRCDCRRAQQLPESCLHLDGLEAGDRRCARVRSQRIGGANRRRHASGSHSRRSGPMNGPGRGPALSARSAARFGLLIALAVTLQIAESLIPRPIPWLRLGLANAVTLLVLVRAGFRAALAVTAIRIVLSGLLL